MPKSTCLVVTGYGDFEIRGVADSYLKDRELSLFTDKDKLIGIFHDVKFFVQRKFLFKSNAVIAQQVEPSICNREVVGSSPIDGSNSEAIERNIEARTKDVLGMKCCHHSSSYDFEQQTCAACRDGGYNR